ncbi:MAG TPA: hypothetical protein VMP08_02825 [Anaerolineae bacterium]|nr:hypothetical protein [Anaerolineae bacterium]
MTHSLTHAQAIQFLHESPQQISTDQQADLAAHLAECDQCRAYADQLAMLQPRLTQALRTRHYLNPADGEIASTILQRRRRSIMQRQVLTAASALASLVVIAITMAAFSQLSNHSATNIPANSSPLATVRADLGLTPSAPFPTAVDTNLFSPLPTVASPLSTVTPTSRLTPKHDLIFQSSIAGNGSTLMYWNHVTGQSEALFTDGSYQVT